MKVLWNAHTKSFNSWESNIERKVQQQLPLLVKRKTLPLHSSPSILVWQSGGHPSQTLWTWFFQCLTLLKSDTVLVDAVPTSENTHMRQAGAKKDAIRKTYADRSVLITTRPLLQTSIPGFFGTIPSKHTKLFPRPFFCFPYNHRIVQWQVLGSRGFAPPTIHVS
jgi:hypothetical protein